MNREVRVACLTIEHKRKHHASVGLRPDRAWSRRSRRLALPPETTWISIRLGQQGPLTDRDRTHVESTLAGTNGRFGLRCTATPWFSSSPFKEERKTSVVATVEQLAELVHGRLVGDGSVSIRSARPVGEAGPGDITFIENDRFAKLLRSSPASAAIVGPTFQSRPKRRGAEPGGHRGR